MTGGDSHLYKGDDCAGCGAVKTVLFGGQQWCTDCAPWSSDEEDESGTAESANASLERWSA